MTFIVKINATEAVMFNINSEFYIDAYTIITANDSLIRYLMKILDRDSISMNKSGYVCIHRKDGSLTTLQRIIMEFYSEEIHNSEVIRLEGLLNHKKHINGNIDVDHINGCKTDNRLTNYQLLEHSQNVNKACGNEFIVSYSNEKILELNSKFELRKQYQTDTDYIKRKSGIFKKLINTGEIKDITDYGYLELDSIDNTIICKESECIDNTIRNIVLEVIKTLTEKHTNFLYDLVETKDRYIVIKVFNQVLQMLSRQCSRNKILKEVIRRFNILNDTTKRIDEGLVYKLIKNKERHSICFKDEKEDDIYSCIFDNCLELDDNGNVYSDDEFGLDFDIDENSFTQDDFNILEEDNNKTNHCSYEYFELIQNTAHTENILYDVFCETLQKNAFVIRDGNILRSISAEDKIHRKGVYSSFRMMYLLGLLDRKWSRDNKYFFLIPKYTDELLNNACNIATKVITWRKVRYFMVRETFDKETADRVYAEHSVKCDFIYRFIQIRSKEDVLDYITNNHNILNYGYIRPKEIFNSIKDLNRYRKYNKENFNIIFKSFSNFISSMLNYNPDTLNLMNDLGYVYVRLNQATIKRIKKYQNDNGIESNEELKPNQTAIVLKRLVKK